MRILLVSGVSGAGKSQAVNILEDFGYYCIDNLPLQAVASFTGLCQDLDIEKLALVTDIRSSVLSNADLTQLTELRRSRPDVQILYLDADDSVLIDRYQETRRPHPLLDTCGSLEEAIHQEKQWLSPLKRAADGIIDTSDKKIADLRDEIAAFLQETMDEIKINVSAFGYKYGMMRSADFVFDTRFLPNPFYKPELRNKTGLDQEVRDFVFSDEEAREYLKKCEELIESILPLYATVGKFQVSVAFGCTGGQHRSVSYAYCFQQYFKDKGYQTHLSTRDIKKDRMNR